MPDDEGFNSTEAPTELIVEKKDGMWYTEDKGHNKLASTLGAEIDVFNYGYGDLLGRIEVG